MAWRARRVAFDDVARLHERLGGPEALAWTLVRRGLAEPEAAEEFLRADGPLEVPELTPGVREAAERLARAVARGEKVVVHGDYDCDGVCSTAIVLLALRARGGRAEAFLPSRFRDGYGVSVSNVERIAAEGARLLVCVDCGTTAVEALSRAVELGLDVIVVDHHLAGGRRPPGIVVNPALGRSREDLPAAAGVALRVVRALEGLEPADQLGASADDLVDLAALATVADAVPLLGDNRRLVARGLRQMREASRPAVAELCRAAGQDVRGIGAHTLGFTLGPSINAAGRLAGADRALDLILAPDADSAAPIARELWQMNLERRELEQAITDEAIAQIAAWPEDDRAADAFVVSGDGWHEGVVGIVASRLVERHHRPVIVITRDGDSAKGSGRSLPGVDLHAIVAGADASLTRWGGHEGAVGLQLPPDRIARFRADLSASAAGARAAIARARVRQVDAVVSPTELSLPDAEALLRLEPFGRGNPEVRLALPGCEVHGAASVGDGRHLRMRLRSGQVHVPAIGFGMGERASELDPEARYDAVVALKIERYQGLVGTRVVVQALDPLTSPAKPLAAAPAGEVDAEPRPALAAAIAAAQTGSLDAEPPTGCPRGVRDRRGRGVALASLAALAGADRGVVAVVADVARRRTALTGPLEPTRLGVEVTVLAGERYSAGSLAELSRAGGGPVLAMVDHVRLPELELPADVHVVAIDPPSDPGQAKHLLAAADGRWLHLVWGEAEVELSLASAEEAYGLRPLATALWRAIREHGRVRLDHEGEELLLAAGGVRRGPRAVARALAALTQLGLARVGDDWLEVSSGAPDGRLEDTPAFLEAQERLEAARGYLANAMTVELAEGREALAA